MCASVAVLESLKALGKQIKRIRMLKGEYEGMKLRWRLA